MTQHDVEGKKRAIADYLARQRGQWITITMIQEVTGITDRAFIAAELRSRENIERTGISRSIKYRVSR